MESQHEIMTLAEVAEALRLPAGTLRYWRHIGLGPRSYKVGRRVVYDRGDVNDYVTEARKAKFGASLPPTDDMSVTPSVVAAERSSQLPSGITDTTGR